MHAWPCIFFVVILFALHLLHAYPIHPTMKSLFSVHLQKNNDGATIFSLFFWPYTTHDENNNVNCAHCNFNKRWRGVAETSSYACNHCQGDFKAAASRVSGRWWCTSKKVTCIHLMSKKITGPPFHGSMITCLKEYSELWGGMLVIFYILVQWWSLGSPLIAWSRFVFAPRWSCWWHYCLWCCSHCF